MKSMRLKRFVVITLSLMMLFSSMSPSLMSVSFAADEGENSEVENVVNNVLTYTNADTEDVQKGDSDAYTITVTGEDNFAEGSSIYISEIQKNELKGYMDDLNTYLEKEMLSAKAVLPLSIDLFDLNGNTIQPGQEVDVAISLLDAVALKKTMLYHQKEDGVWEKVAYKILETNEGASIEFNVDSFSPFIFVNEIEVEPTKEEGSDDKNIEPNSESKKEDVNEQTASEKKQPEKAESDSKDTKDNKVEGANEIKEPTKKADNKADDSIARDNSAVQSQKDDVEAISLYGDAAKDEGEAIDALKKDLSLSRKDAKNVANDLFNVKAAKGATRGEDEDVPRQGDGSNIENISAKWITDDTVDNGDSSLLYYKPSGDSPFDVRLQINYALSGEHNYDPGDITITIPENIFKNRTGKYACEVILPYPEDPSTKADFNWKLVDGNYVLTNTKRMSAATKGYIQIGFAGLKPHDLVDMAVSEDFDAYIEVTTHKGNLIALRSNKLNAQFDTEAKLVNNSVRKSNKTVERVPASEIPANQRINGEEEYILVTWYVYGSTTANTWYTLDSVDSIPQNASVTNDLKESDVHGFIVGATSGDGIELTKDNMYHGYSSGQTSYYSFKTAYPASQFEPNIVYTFHNKIHMTVTEDDPAAEVTNPNVQAEDPQLVTEGEYTAQTTWSYRLPEWNNPTGHFMVCKNGNDNKVGNNQTHHSSYPGSSSSDIHIWKNKSPIDMWYGIYPSGMNDLDEGKDMYLSYTIDSVGYTMPWMFNEVSYETDGELAARKAINYNLPVTMITEDTGVRLGNSKQKLTVHEDFEFVSVEFPPRPYVYTGKPKNINPDGSWEALTAGDGTFEYKLDSNYSHYPDITLEIYRNGGWEEYAMASWKTGSVKITLANGDVVSGAIVDLPSDTENFRTQVTVQNTLDENLSNVISQAAIDYDVRPVIKLYDTDAVKALVTAGFEATHTPSMYVYNGVNMKAYDSNNAEIVSIDKEGHDVLRGYTTDVTVYPSKAVRQTLKDADYVNRQVTLHYSAKVEERSVINDKKTYEQAVADGRLAAETHGFWYDLLPRGVTPDISSVKLRSGDKLLSVRTEENYKNSGRTLLIVEVELKPTPERYRAGDMYYYEDVPSISFDAWYAFDALTDYGKSIHNVIAFESSNDHIGTVDGYSGESDNPNTGEDNNVSTHLAFSTDDEKTWMTDLDEERDNPSFVYAGVSNTIDIISAARLSLQKDVMVNNDGRWGTGVFNSDLTAEGGEPSYTYNENSKAENEMVVWEGGLYSYKLRMMPDDETRAKDMVIYDSLETFKAGDGNEPIDEIAANENATWQGKFIGVDVSQLEDMGCAPVVYYSTIPNLALSDETNPEVGNRANMLFNEDNTINSSVWTRADQYGGDLSAVTAIAVDASKKANGSDFTLEPLESIVVLINMRAPSGDEARDIIANNGPWGTSAYAYNNAYLTGTTIDIDTLDEDSDNFVRKDYTKVGLVEYQYNVKKVWNDDNNRDGIRPENITVHLLADGTDTGESLLLDADNNWKASFEHIPYTTPDGKKIKYSVLEDEVTNYSTDITGSEASSTITNGHVPEKISLTVNKNWRNDTEQDRPDYITIELYGNGKKVTSKRIDASTNWTCTFTDLFKNENGIPIRYTAKETFPNGDVKHLSYIASEPDGLVLVGLLTPDATPDLGDPLSIREDEDHVFTNTYHPYGDLYVNKNVTNVTSVSAEQDFEFTFDFSIDEDGEDVPVFDEYDYDVLDDAGHVVSSGKISNNGTISIKGGQRIHVKEIDEYVKYKVTEKEEEGFKQVNATNTEGIVSPNSDAVVSFDNNYSAKGNFNPVVEKILKNRELRKYQFKFEMYQIFEEQNDNGIVTTTENLIRTATSGKPDDPVLREDGTVESSHATAAFGAIKYTQEDANTQVESGKPYRYKVVEVKSDKAGYTYDETVYYVDVAVTDNGDGTLNIVPTYYKEIPPEEGGILDGLGDLIFGEDDPTYEEVENPAFVNEYKAEGEIVLRAWKDLQGRKLTDGEFEFELLDENGQPVYKVNPETGEPTDEPMTATNTEDGSVVFDAIKFDETDIGKTFNYAIREKTGTDDTVNYDENVYGYSVTVYDNGDGTLSFSQVPATPITEMHDCDACEGTGYMIDDDHPYVVYGPYDGIYSPDDNRWAEVFVAADMGGPYMDWRKYNYRSLGYVDGFIDQGWERYSFDDGSHSYILANIAANMITGDVSNVRSNGIGTYVNLDDIETISSTDGTDPNIGEVVESKTVFWNGVFYDLIKSGSSRSYSGYWSLDYYLAEYSSCEACNGIGECEVITGWNTDEGELPVFRNTLKDGSLSVIKNITNPDEADPTQKFKFKVKLIGDNIEDKEFDYELSQATPKGEPSLTVRFVDPDTQESIPNVSVICRTQPQGNGNVIGNFVADENGEITLFFEDLDMSEYEGAKYLCFEPSNAPSPYYAPTPNGDWNEWVTVVWHDNTLDMYPSYYDWSEVSGVPESGYVYTLTLPKRASKSASVKNDDTNEKSLEKTTEDINTDKTTSSKAISSKIAEKIVPPVYAADDDIASGTFDGVDWRVTADYELIIGKAGEVQSYSMSSSNRSFPWKHESFTPQITSVRFEGNVIGNGNMAYMFGDSVAFETNVMTNLTSFNADGFDTSNVTDMSYMFANAGYLTDLDLSGFDTFNVTNMTGMFCNCTNLTYIDISTWDTSNVISMGSIFPESGVLQRIKLGPDFRFKGNRSGLPDMTQTVYKEGSGFSTKLYKSSLKWSRSDGSYGPYTAEELKNNYTSAMAGTWVVDAYSYAVFDDTDNTLYFVKSNEVIDNNTVGTIHSISGNTYTGMIYGVAENRITTSNISATDFKWRTWASKVSITKKVIFVDVFRPASTHLWFSGCNKCEMFDFQKLDTRNVSNMTSMLNACDNATKFILGENFTFKPRTNVTTDLPTPPAEKDGVSYTRKWIKEDESEGPYTPVELRNNYTPEMAGTWIWEIAPTKYTIGFAAEEGAAGAMASVEPVAAEDYQLPKNKFARFGYEFDHWDDGNGRTYADMDTIPAGTYAIGDRIIFTAVFVPRDTTVNMENGEFEFELYGGETATFNNIPAGTTYQVYEETPDGWVLIEQSNVSGTIEPLETAASSFTNKYEPGTTTAQFFGTKTLDGQAAEADSYSFILDETTEGASGTVKMLVDGEEQDVELPYTVTVSEGGFIQFPAIKYLIDDIGEHTYTVREVNPNDDHIDYDTHVETIKVNVTGDVTELKAETVIDEDGDGKVAFANKTRPGELRITKNGENVTNANKDDEFTFKVSLSNDKGLPLSDDNQIYWYKTDANGNIIQDEDDTANDENNNNGQKSVDTKDNKRAIEEKQEKVTEQPEEFVVDHIEPSRNNTNITQNNIETDNIVKSGDVVKLNGNAKINSLNNIAKGSNTKAAGDIHTITYHSGSAGSFEDDSDTNIVGYKEKQVPVSKYSHTNNISDNGIRSGGFGNNQKLKDVVTIPNAESIHVDIRYGTQGASTSYGRLYVVPGEYTGDITTTEPEGTLATLSGYSNNSQYNTASYDISEDTVTFGFYSGNNTFYNTGSGKSSYGYYAVVTGTSIVQEINSGSYVDPTPLDEDYRFVSWSTEPDGSGDTVNPAKVRTDMDLYAQYEYDAVAEGTDGGVSWKLKNDGTFVLYPTNGVSGTLASHHLVHNVDGDGYVDSYPQKAGIPWRDYASSVTRVIIKPGVKANTYADCLFFNMNNCTEFSGLENLDVSSATTMFAMFYWCKSVVSLDLSSFDTSNLVDIEDMFGSCDNLSEINVSNWDTSNLVYLHNAFDDNPSLKSIDLSGWDTSKVNLRQYRTWTSSHSYTYHYLRPNLFGNSAISEVTIGENFDFQGSITAGPDYQILFPALSAANGYTGRWIRNDGAYGPFTREELRDNYTPEMAGTWIAEIAENPYAVLAEDGTMYFVREQAIYENGSEGTVHSISGEDYSGTIFKVNEVSTGRYDNWSSVAEQVKKVVFVDEVKPASISYWFNGFTQCTEFDLEKLNTENIQYMQYLFSQCKNISSLDLREFNTNICFGDVLHYPRIEGSHHSKCNYYAKHV